MKLDECACVVSAGGLMPVLFVWRVGSHAHKIWGAIYFIFSESKGIEQQMAL